MNGFFEFIAFYFPQTPSICQYLKHDCRCKIKVVHKQRLTALVSQSCGEEHDPLLQ